MKIEVKNQQKKVPIAPPKITRIAKKVLNKEGVTTATLSIVFVTDRKIRSINKKFLNKDCTTDVIAFDLSDEEISRSRKKVKCIEGEIVISTPAAFQNAKCFKTSADHEITLYLIHGILHLLGYDDHKKADIERIRRKEKEILEMISDEL